MSMENIIKEKTEEVVEKYRKSMESNGLPFPDIYEDLLRQGISYGVSFAAMALASAPMDIALKSDVVEEKTPIKVDIDTGIRKDANKVYHVIRCSKCGGDATKTNYVLTSNPPKYVYECGRCGNTEYREV